MKKYVLLILFLVLVVGGSKVDKNVLKIKTPIDLKFHGMNLLVDNSTDNNIVIFDSKTEFSTKKMASGN